MLEQPPFEVDHAGLPEPMTPEETEEFEQLMFDFEDSDTTDFEDAEELEIARLRSCLA